jgi:glycogen debranching enzyme
MFERDSAYHRGTVWAWPIGPYVEGWLRANKFSKDARAHAREAVRPLLDALSVDSLGQLHEVFDGDAPHRSEGCIAQAWSIAEVLRAVVLIESKK